MRSKKAELEDVVKQFEAWRAKPHGRLIPEELWKAALGLLDRYAPSTICSHLRVNAARFKQVRESGGAVVGEKRFKGHGRTGATGRSPRTVQDRSAAERVTALAPSGNAFVELPQFGMGLGGGMMTPPLGEVQHGASRCRLTVESAAGSLTVVTASGEGENELVEAVCRFVLGALEGSYETWYGMPIRWLQEMFPIDEIFARELGIDIDATRFEKVDDGPIVYQVEVTDRNGSVIYSDSFAPRFTTREYFPYKPTAKIHYTTGGFQARVNGELVADANVRTDPERLWDFYQNEALPKMFEYATEYTGGNLGLESQPFFRQLFFEIRLSEPDFLLDLDEERISSLDSLHEDLTFDTIDFWSIFSGNPSGSREVAPGRITPMIYPNHQGPPELRVTVKGNAVPRPRLVVEWRGAQGTRGERSIDLKDLGLESPRVAGLRVRAGQTGASEIRVSLGADGYESATIATKMVRALADIQESGSLREALSYARLDSLQISTELGSAALEESIRPADRNVLPQPGDFPTITPERGKRIVTWDHVIAPAELENELIPRLRTFPEINAYVAGQTYRDRNVWAMDVMLPMEAELWCRRRPARSNRSSTSRPASTPTRSPPPVRRSGSWSSW